MSWRLATPLILATALAVAAALMAPGGGPGVEDRTAAAAGDQRACPPGFVSYADYAAGERRIEAMQPPDAASDLRAAANAYLDAHPELAGLEGMCLNQKLPERFDELALRAASQATPRMAPLGAWRQGALSAAITQRQQMEQMPVPASAAGQGEAYGRGPLIVDDLRFGVANLGLADNMGRIDDLKHDLGADAATTADDRVFAAVGNGGIWMSEDLGENWVSLNENLPNITSSAVAYSTFEGGSLVALSGDSTYGSAGYVGTGAYYTRDLGETWTKSEGVPDGALGFAAVTHPQRPEEIYLGTSLGLFKSTDGGASFAVVPLPVGATTADGEPCDGVTDIAARPDCTFANHVTDVVIQEPGGTTAVGDDAEPVIVAAVGWRGGMMVEPGTEAMQAPANGIYRSTDGGNEFAYVPPPAADQPTDFAEAERIGRIELGPATGPDQDHNYLYAIVQDAIALNGGINTIDAPNGDVVTEPVPYATALEGVYVSSDFGASWIKVADDQDFQSPASGSGLIGTIALGFAPGIQAWYNLCVKPDPTQTDPATGAPTRLIVCLEEVWQNDDFETGVRAPVVGPSSFKVIGRYFSGATCAFLLQFEPCPAERGPTNTLTTHPDQHTALFVPIPAEDPDAEEAAGGVHLMMGNDGGFYRQTAGPAEEFDNGGWGDGLNAGFNTLLPYRAATAKDNSVWFGLQDNGSGLIDPRPNPAVEGVEDDRDGEEFLQYEVIGGDGFFVAVDPDNSDVAYTERPGGAMTVTTNRGRTHSALAPPITHAQFSNPFIMDPTNADHLMTAGCEVVETTFGPGTGGFPGFDWVEVFQLGDLEGGECPAEGEPANAISAVDLERDSAYVGFCGECDILNTELPFQNGLATNVAGEDIPLRMTSQGWHFAAAEGLPNRFITSIEVDPQDTRTIYVTLGGYTREWTPPGSLGDENADIGEGHLFVSHDAGETFTDISSNLPDVTATWVALRGERQLIVGTDIGAFTTGAEGVTDDQAFTPLEGVPFAPVASIEVTPQDQDLLTIALYGRGIYQYRFDEGIEDIDYRRFAGIERIETSALTAAEQFPRGADTVVIARADEYADALVSVPLAYQEHAPIILTYPDGLHPEAAGAVEDLGATRAILIGSALTEQVEDDLADAGIDDVERYGGDNAFETAAAVGAQLLGSDEVAPDVYVVEGQDPDPARGWPDTMAIGPLAATQGRPILLVETDEVPDATLQALEDFGAERVTVVGGTVAVSEATRSGIEEEAEVEVSVLAGATRYETSKLIADRALVEHLDERRVWLATGDNYPDALSAGASIAANGGVLMLVPRDDLDNAPPAITFLREHSDDVRIVRFLGGTAAISGDVAEQVEGTIGLGPLPDTSDDPLVGETVLGPFGFETGPEEWETSTTEPTTMWKVAPPGDASAQSFQVAPYNNESSALLSSPAFEHPGGPLKLTWSQRLNTEDGFDFLTVGWIVTEPGGRQRSNIVGGYTGMNPDYPTFTPQETTFQVPAGEVRIFYRFTSDQLVNGEGAYVDNVLIER